MLCLIHEPDGRYAVCRGETTITRGLSVHPPRELAAAMNIRFA